MDFAEYNEHTEELVRFLIERLNEDDVLAGAMRRPGLTRAWHGIRKIRGDITDYRTAVHKWINSDGVVRWYWMLVARCNAHSLRQAGRLYTHREGFDPAWLRPPQRR